MKKLFFLLLLFTFSSCVILKQRNERFERFYPGKVLLKGKSNCNITPKPLFKE